MNETAFRPDPEMFVCMDPTGCYHVSWNAEQHAAKMAQVGAKHEARYLAASPSPSMEMEERFPHSGMTTAEAVALIDSNTISGLRIRLEAAEEAENEAKDCFWAIYPRYLELGGEPVSTEAARTNLSAQVLRLTEENEALRKERDEAVSIARNVTKALVDLTPSGSEYFTHSSLLDCYYADTEACTRAVRDRFDSGHKAKIERVDERRRAEAAEARIKALEEALREISRDVVHTSFGAKPTRGAEIARSTLQKEPADG